MNPAEVHYRIDWRATSHFPGAHASRQQGGGLRFRNHASLLNAPDPRRFDIHASLRDPFEQLQVRIYSQTSTIAVYVLADLSASMGVVGAHAKNAVLAELVASLSYSAYRMGDRFGFVGCADDEREPWLLPATMNRGAGHALADALRSEMPNGRDAQGMLKAAELLGPRRALVFLVSDFFWPPALLDAVLESLAYHDVVPVVLWDRQECEQLPRYGLVRVVDAETQRSRLLLMRPTLKRRIQQAFEARLAQLQASCARFGRLPLVLEDGFDADRMSQYFYD